MKRAAMIIGVLSFLLLLPLSMAFANGSKESSSSSSSPATSKTTLTFWNGFTASDGQVMRQIVDKFNSTHSNITINMNIMPWSVFYQKLPPAISTGTAPSFVLLSDSDLPVFVPNGSIIPLDNFFSKTGTKESIFPKSVLDMGKFDGKYYELPMQPWYLVLYWNKTLFKEAGLPLAPPTTWSQLADYAVKLTNSSKGQYGFGMPTSVAPPYFMTLLWDNGGQVLDVQNNKVLLDSPANIQSLKALRALSQKNVSPLIQGPELDNLVMSGKLAMYINGPWDQAGMNKNKIDYAIAAPPAGSVAQTDVTGGNGFAIPTSTKSADIDAIYTYIKYWYSLPIAREWSLKNNDAPYINYVANDPAIKANPNIAELGKLPAISRQFLPGSKYATQITNNVMWPLIEQVLRGKGTIEEDVTAAAQKIEQIISAG